MIIKSMVLGILVFLFDLLIFGYVLIVEDNKKKSAKELKKLKTRLGFVIPIVLLIQVFFSIVLMYTFSFLLAFHVFDKNIIGGISFAFLFFVPMLYLLMGSWLWGDKQTNARLAPSIISWVVKFSIAGIYIGIVA